MLWPPSPQCEFLLIETNRAHNILMSPFLREMQHILHVFIHKEVAKDSLLNCCLCKKSVLAFVKSESQYVKMYSIKMCKMCI